MNLSGQWQRLSEQVNQRSLRERVMLLSTMLVVVYFLITGLITPSLDTMRKNQEQALSMAQAKLLAYRQETRSIENRYLSLTKESYQQRVDQLIAQISSVDASLANLTESLVGPEAMADLIRDILSSRHHLQLVQLKNLPPVSLFSKDNKPDDSKTSKNKKTDDSQDSQESASTKGLIYKHGMLIELTGRFNDIVGFLDALEHSRHKVLWQEMTLQSETAPRSTVSLLVYTLSLEPTWLGV